MRVVKVIWNQELGDGASYSFQAEVILGESDDPTSAGRDALGFLADFNNGMSQEAEDRAS